MTHLSALWLPVVLSSVIVFIASSVIHMVLPWHKGDFRKLPNEDRFRDAVGPLAIPPGDYMVPRVSHGSEMKSPEYAEKIKKGPVIIMTVLPNQMLNMGQSLLMWFVYTLVIGVFCAYIAGRALPRGTDYLHVFRFAGATAFMCYSVGLWQTSIWYKRAWKTTMLTTLDGLIYGLLTAGTFGWLWPK